MSVDRSRLPDAVTFFESEGLTLAGRGRWRTTSCTFHGGSDSLRVNVTAGGWICMACNARGGDLLAYVQAAYGLDFVEAARRLDCWIDDDKPTPRRRPTPITPRDALQVLSGEASLVAVAASNVAYGSVLTQLELDRLLTAAGRITRIAELFS